MRKNRILNLLSIKLILIILIIFSGCVGGPGVLENYSRDSKNIDKYEQKNILLYRVIIEGDNYDKVVQKIILDKIRIYFGNINAGIVVSEDIFKNDIDDKNLIISEEYLNQNFDFIFLLIIRTKNLGYSIRTLSDETNINLNSTLFDGAGSLLTSSLFSKVTLYPISNIRKFHFDLMRVLSPMSSFIQPGSKKIKK